MKPGLWNVTGQNLVEPELEANGAGKITRVGDLYCLIFADGRLYIGASTSGAIKRYREHERAARLGSSLPVHKAWRKYGPPKLIVLIKNLEVCYLWKAEKEAIDKYKTRKPFGHNGICGSGVIPGTLGKTRSDSSRKKQSQTTRGKPKSEEHKRNISLGQLGMKHSEERRNNNRLGVLKWNREHTVSAETRRKRSNSLRGRKFSEEHKKKLRQAALKREALKREIKPSKSVSVSI